CSGAAPWPGHQTAATAAIPVRYSATGLPPRRTGARRSRPHAPATRRYAGHGTDRRCNAGCRPGATSARPGPHPGLPVTACFSPAFQTARIIGQKGIDEKASGRSRCPGGFGLYRDSRYDDNLSTKRIITVAMMSRTSTLIAFATSDRLHEITNCFIQRMRSNSVRAEPETIERIMAMCLDEAL